TYAADDSQAAIQHLNAGASLADTFTVTSQDGSKTQDVTVTIHGTNDAPVFGWGETAAPLTEQSGQTASSTVLVKSGQLLFTDIDVGDTHGNVTVTPVSTNNPGGTFLGTFTAGLTSEPNDAAMDNGRIDWHLSAVDSSLDFLAAGQVVTQVYNVTVTDANGASSTESVTATFTGSNDAPHISLATGDADHAYLTETNAGLSTSGTLTANDVDVTDVLTAQVVSVSAGGSGILNYVTLSQLQGFLTLANPVDTATTTSGQIHWTFNSGAQAFDFLPSGWQSVVDYTIQVADGNGGSDQHVVEIKLTGTNDVPVIAGTTSGDVTEDVAVQAGNLTTSGTLTIIDADAGQSNFQAATIAGSGHYGTFAVDTTGHWTYAADDSQAAIQHLNAGASLADTFTVTSQDGSKTQDVTVTIHGTNDA
ncbi:MAG: VCBS domain-containing protein, partial [Mycobacterium sp.]|nr:VCBS domain-containing protein [Mycobacterium sp.]